MAPYDAIAKRNVDDERIAFARKLLDAAVDIVSFVDKRLEWNGAGRYDGLLGASFNISLKVKRDDSDEHVIIRFPSPGKVHGPWREEKVKNEVMAMNYVVTPSSLKNMHAHCQPCVHNTCCRSMYILPRMSTETSHDIS